MKIIPNDFSLDYSQNLEDGEITIYKIDGKKRVTYCTKVESVNKKTIDSYIDFHDVFMTKFLEKHSSNPKFRLMLIFDLRDTKYDEWMTTVLPFIKIQNKYKNDYKSHLICTVIIINSKEIKTILDTLFSTLYFPARPIEIINSSDTDIQNNIDKLWSKHLQ